MNLGAGKRLALRRPGAGGTIADPGGEVTRPAGPSTARLRTGRKFTRSPCIPMPAASDQEPSPGDKS
jgi:hypothetical protein